MKRILSFCEHPIGVDTYKDKRCTCGRPATTQMRLYIKPGDTKVGSLAFNRYYCFWCLKDFRSLMCAGNIKKYWKVKIDLPIYTLEQKVEFEVKFDGDAKKTGKTT